MNLNNFENVTHSAQGETVFLRGIFCLEYPSWRSEKEYMFISQTTDFHFANYRFSFRKLQIFISQTTDFHFANYRFPFRKLQILRFPFRKLQISISQTTDFHFVSSHFVSQTTVSLDSHGMTKTSIPVSGRFNMVNKNLTVFCP